MKTAMNYIREVLGIEIPDTDVINGSWFAENGLPMVMGCRCCLSTCSLFGGYIDEEEYFYCPACAGK